MDIIVTILAAALIAELTGYLMHILLHSNKIAFLSKSHMIHHLVLYGPKCR
jgi:sterol desaturase/sphingolipid hydroxylase (fatty acid hydroxylase superfamily)